MSKSLLNKRALVTGAGTGIGRAIALELARRGASVAVHCSRSAEGARSLVWQICGEGGNADVFTADFRYTDPIATLAQEAVGFLGGIDVLVNNAGITMNRPFSRTTVDQFDTLLAVNVRAPYFLTQALLPELEESRGVIINISSIHAYEAYNEHSVYACTRGAIVSLTRNLAIELAPYGVRVVGIAPGSVLVESHLRMQADKAPEEIAEEAGKGIPCGFVGMPADIANAAAFLASDDARYIVGQTLIIDGGTTSWMPFGDQFASRPGVQFGRGYVPGV